MAIWMENNESVTKKKEMLASFSLSATRHWTTMSHNLCVWASNAQMVEQMEDR